MANIGDADLDGLKREREEKVRQIAEKRKQIEELKARRAKRLADREKSASQGGEKSVDDLLTEMLGADGDASVSLVGDSSKPLQPASSTASRSAKRERKPLQADRVAIVAMDPQQGNVIDASIQTDVVEDQNDKKKNTTMDNLMSNLSKLKAATSKARAKPALNGKNSGTFASQEFLTEEAIEPTTELSPDEKSRILSSPDFQAFFKRTSLLVERTLGQDSFDMDADFAGFSGDAATGESSDQLDHVDDYVEERWAVGRPVTDVRFSPHRKEFFLAAYGQKGSPSLSDPDGCVLLWNLAMQKKPEFCFTCQSAVMTAHFHRFNPAVFFGGTYSGGVVLWDARAKSGPVQRTPLSAKGHSHPVQAMQQVGTQNATNLVTASNDGRLCVWSLAMMVHPQETIDLKNEKSSNRRDLAVMALSFPENETNILYVGAEDGSVCQVHIHGSKIGVTESYDGHEGPVTGIDMHPHGDAAQQQGVEAISDLVLSCSFDWSVKLWMVKQSQSPMLSIDLYEDYIYDVRWHPAHPAIFATVDGEGHVDLWNLNKDMESPVVRCEKPNQGHQRLALNRCYWSSDGRRLTTGDSEGTLSVYALDKTLAQPRNEDFIQFQERVRNLQPIVARGRDGGYSLDSKYGRYGGFDTGRY